MKKKTGLKKTLWILMILLAPFLSNAQSITENFDDITTLAANGWVMQNNSNPVGTTNWFQGTSVAGGGPFDSYNGAANSYIGANFNNTTGGSGTISNWLVTPYRTLRNGDVITFYTRKPTGTDYPDRLEFRISTNGASSYVGVSATDVGDFNQLLLSVNPSLVTGVYPTTWTQYTVTISGLSSPVSGRMAFRYYVTSAGPTGTNSDYIGIDAFTYTPYVCPTLSVSPSSLPNGVAGTTYSQTMSQTGALGAPTYAITAGALPPGVSLSAAGSISGTPTATGLFNFTTTVMDNSGCTGSGSYAISIVCPANVATLSAFPALCNNGPIYDLIEGYPAGGTYSGTGVSGSSFNPAALTQTITYDYTDPYGCAHSATRQIKVSIAPAITATATVSTVCQGESLTLSGNGGSIYTWNNGVTNLIPFAPTATADYILDGTDTTNCHSFDTITITVNPLPTVSATVPATNLCITDADMTLGGTPLGGVWTVNGTPAVILSASTSGAGNYEAVYSYTDANNCNATDTVQIVVDLCTGLGEYSNAEYAMYPNPANDLLYFELAEATDISIYNTAGQVVYAVQQVSGKQVIDLSAWLHGVYLVSLVTSDGVHSLQLIHE
jgi:hypothetical protein